MLITVPNATVVSVSVSHDKRIKEFYMAKVKMEDNWHALLHMRQTHTRWCILKNCARRWILHCCTRNLIIPNCLRERIHLPFTHTVTPTPTTACTFSISHSLFSTNRVPWWDAAVSVWRRESNPANQRYIGASDDAPNNFLSKEREEECSNKKWKDFSSLLQWQFFCKF